MYKVLIVDDEVFVVTLIEKLIDWNAFDMEVVGKAYNGKEALGKIEELTPDIVIVDVCMPEYDGIMMIQKVREINKNIKLIIISGHKKFEYAKSAMQYKVEDYLLKPINKKELEGILAKIKEKLDQEQMDVSVIENLDNQLGDSKIKLHMQLMERMINRKLEKGTDLVQINTYYYTKFHEGKFLLLLLRTDSADKQPNEAVLAEVYEKISKGSQEYINEWCYDVLYWIEGTKIWILCNCREDSVIELLKSMKSYCDKLEEELNKFETLKLTMGVSRIKNTLYDVSDGFKEAQTAIRARIILKTERCIYYKDIKEDLEYITNILDAQAKDKILEAIKTFDMNKIKPLFVKCFNKADMYKYEDNLIYFRLSDEILHLVFDYFKQIGLYKSTYEKMRTSMYKQLDECTNAREILNGLCRYLEIYIEHYAVSNEPGKNPAVRVAKLYIAENYQNNITLTDLAQIVNLTPVYFSILFKKEVGVNFLEYLNRYRIGQAKEYLKDIKYNVNEIAGMVGFQDARYFSKMFKKVVGILPSEYRNRHFCN